MLMIKIKMLVMKTMKLLKTTTIFEKKAMKSKSVIEVVNLKSILNELQLLKKAIMAMNSMSSKINKLL